MNDLSLPCFSIFVTCYNLERYIYETLASVFTQDYKGPLEVIIVDDGSRDNSWDEIQKAVEELGAGWDVTLIRNKQNMGILATTELAWSAAKYEWLLEVDGDDIQLPDRCSKVAEVIEKYPDVTAILFSACLLTADGTPLNDFVSYDMRNYAQAPDELYLNTPVKIYENHFFSAHTIASLGATECYRRSTFEQWGKHEHCSKSVFQDTVWTWRCKLSGAVYASKQIACLYRCHANCAYNVPAPSCYKEYVRDLRQTVKIDLQRYHFLVYAVSDIDKALATPGLSNWPPKLLLKAKDIFEQELPVKKILSEWWNFSFFQRIRIFIRHYKELPPFYRAQMRRNILPLYGTAFLLWVNSKLKKRE